MEWVKRLALALAGALFLMIAAVDFARTRDFVSRSQPGEATVVSLYAGTSHPKLTFTDPRGDTIEFYASGWISHRVGERVPVRFLASDPRGSVQVDEPGSLWFLPVLFGLLGSGALIAGLFTKRRR